MLLLAGCVSMSGIEPLAKTTEPNRLEAGKTIVSAVTIEWPKEDWWKAYRDPQLDALVSKTITGSPTLRVAQARIAL